MLIEYQEDQESVVRTSLDGKVDRFSSTHDPKLIALYALELDKGLQVQLS